MYIYIYIDIDMCICYALICLVTSSMFASQWVHIPWRNELRSHPFEEVLAPDKERLGARLEVRPAGCVQGLIIILILMMVMILSIHIYLILYHITGRTFLLRDRDQQNCPGACVAPGCLGRGGSWAGEPGQQQMGI